MLVWVFPPLGVVGWLWIWLCILLPLLWLVILCTPWLIMIGFYKASTVISDYDDVHGVIDSKHDHVWVEIMGSSIIGLE